MDTIIDTDTDVSVQNNTSKNLVNIYNNSWLNNSWPNDTYDLYLEKLGQVSQTNLLYDSIDVSYKYNDDIDLHSDVKYHVFIKRYKNDYIEHRVYEKENNEFKYLGCNITIKDNIYIEHDDCQNNEEVKNIVYTDCGVKIPDIRSLVSFIKEMNPSRICVMTKNNIYVNIDIIYPCEIDENRYQFVCNNFNGIVMKIDEFMPYYGYREKVATIDSIKFAAIDFDLGKFVNPSDVGNFDGEIICGDGDNWCHMPIEFQSLFPIGPNPNQLSAANRTSVD